MEVCQYMHTYCEEILGFWRNKPHSLRDDLPFPPILARCTNCTVSRKHGSREFACRCLISRIWF